MDEEEKEYFGLSINRVPKKTLDDFKKLAFEEFANDYGMTLKYLLDMKKIDEEIKDIYKRIEKIEEVIMNGSSRQTIRKSKKDKNKG